jgi:uncharacterized membrane protein YgcG
MRPFKAVLLFAIFMASATSLRAEEERVLSFLSEVTVYEDASLIVSETIEIMALGQEIKRGIVRDFPVVYDTPYGNRVHVGFEILEITRDAHVEPYFTEREGNNIKIYIGERDVFLKPGRTTYKITYRTTGQLGFFEDFDELYWNVTGNDWSFPIERAEARVQLPPGAAGFGQSAYTGRRGAQGRDFSRTQEGATTVFRTTRPLKPGEGLTIAVAWQKGLVIEPGWLERYGHYFGDQRRIVAAGIGFLLVLAYYIIVWVLVGRDPAGGAVIARFRPPEGLSPAATRYIAHMGYDNKTFAAALVSLAVKGRLTIEQDGSSYHLISADPDARDLTAGERKLARRLFAKGSSLELKQKNHKAIRGAMDALKKALDHGYEVGYFIRNRYYFLPGLGLALISFLVVAFLSDDWPIALFLTLWLTIWSLGCYGLLRTAISAWRSVIFVGGFLRMIPALLITCFGLPFFAAEGFALFTLGGAIGYLPAAILVLDLVVVFAFYHWLQAPTHDGRRLMDEIEGFRLYLGVAEQPRLESLHPPEETPDLFESYLPYALALDVENQWCARFAARSAAALAGDGEASGYRPSWYHGSALDAGDFSRLGSSLGDALSGAASTAASPPGSSSGGGSSGGGSSGGGGGGGGGSGW